MATTFAIYLDPRGGAGGTVNRASFDGHFTCDDVRDREDPYGRALFSAAVHARTTGSVGCFISQDGVDIYVERIHNPI